MAKRPLLPQRLDTYIATVRSSAMGRKLQNRAGNWRLYAAVTSSAMAMATAASAALIGSADPDAPPDSAPSASATKQRFAGSQNAAVINAARLAVGKKAVDYTAAATPGAAPAISPGGVVPIFGNVNTIQPGEWISIYGSNLASQTASWSGNFPTTLGNTSVTINGRQAYLLFVSPGQINLQAPDDPSTGTVPVVVTTPAGSATSSVTLSQFAPSFSVTDITQVNLAYVAGVISKTNGEGRYGGGSYDVLGSPGTYSGVTFSAANPGDMVSIYGVGFGPTTPMVSAGQLYSGAAPLSPGNTFTLYINNVPITPSFVGISSAGLYQINFTVPAGLGQGNVPITAVVGGMQTQANIWFPLALTQGPIYSSFPSYFSYFAVPGGAGTHHKKHRTRYSPRLQFPNKPEP